MFGSRSLALGALALWAFNACGKSETPRGGLMLVVSQDGPLGLDRLDVNVSTTAGRELLDNTYRLPAEAELPTTLAIVSNGDPTATAVIRVSGWKDDVPLDVRDAIVRQIPTDRVAELRVVLSGRCGALVEVVDDEAVTRCGDGSGKETCDPETGTCTSSQVDASTLDTYHQGDEHSTGGSGGTAGSGTGGSAGSAGLGMSGMGGEAGEGGADGTAGGTGGSSGGKGGNGGKGGSGGNGGTSAGRGGVGGGGAGGKAGNAGSAGMGGSAGGVTFPPDCGNGVVNADEACDDGNNSSADGCVADCSAVETGFMCPPGTACQAFAVCGDGVVASPELCDDGNGYADDGCSGECVIETGYVCSGSPSDCQPTDCGNSELEGSEDCDDGNTEPFDGCSAKCTHEPDCTGAGCTSQCGDGIRMDAEQCDDGNALSGDGCSSLCQAEDGFLCGDEGVCSCQIVIPVLYRDFQKSHSDFDCLIEDGAIPIDATLGVTRKPTLTPTSHTCVASRASFAEWFTTTANNRAEPSFMHLWGDGNGSFVSRHGGGGEQWIDLTATPLDGNPAFFPVDWASNAFNDSRQTADIPPSYTGDSTTHPETDFIPEASTHNFRFTTEIERWFRFESDTNIEIKFEGDNDFWAFVNGQRVIDLGGIHPPTEDSATIDAATGPLLGLEIGKLYSVHLFHAERAGTTSTFKLTLTGLDGLKNACAPSCGDGILVLGEQCDDGIFAGGYGECQPGCVVGPRCGDGTVQMADGEECDDGNTLDGDACTSGCKDAN